MATNRLSEGRDMSMREPDLAQQLALRIKQYATYANAATELAAINAALASDTTTHSKVIEEPPPGLKVLHSNGTNVAGAYNTAFTNDINVLINKAKAGNLNQIQIISALADALGVAHAPSLIDVPYCSAVGSVANVTNGNWGGSPTGYGYAWKRDGATSIGTNSNQYTMVGADTGHQIGCVVTATNANGSTVAPLSNTVRGP
jgi:hypothetical protein